MFCAVIAVTAFVLNTPRASQVLISACRPAPPPLSLPETSSTCGGPSAAQLVISSSRKRSIFALLQCCSDVFAN